MKIRNNYHFANVRLFPAISKRTLDERLKIGSSKPLAREAEVAQNKPLHYF